MQILFCLLMFIFGASLGSFLCCQARRLRRHEKRKKSLGPRSVCLHCGHQLKWYENLPIISWLIQKGKCRTCHRKIGLAEFLSELLTAIALALISARLDLASATLPDWCVFVATVIYTLLLVFLAIYDGLYGELPTLILTISTICAIIVSALRLWALFSASQPAIQLAAQPASQLASQFSWSRVTDTVLAALILGGLYLFIYLVSRGKWVGDGDWLLATGIGLALGTPFLALVALFVANFSACLISAPSAIKRRNRQIYFGPFLVFAYVITLALCDIIKL